MNVAVKRVYVDVPEDELGFFQTMIKKLGWKQADERDAFIDEFVDSLPKEPLMSEEEIIEECKAVRYEK